ncbi:hypothetical protein EJ05DRAFT_211341 [Pseudovirgaria hyperparasitica]|uniref:DUF2293 domain-containing protein n=1 Tax=Pseudovirgaria hyperparasitica TaxID=470096 RepID=A0A6A6VUN9_9PEZI|nr:uncharacterized protein EJ05DRAFT_211341 [Pseudovirgaria hyperparasitica]KAF2753330.1 hypothetical protein EJ05DRAFT_211341 [Pseudovirgaria hyperparasitica]
MAENEYEPIVAPKDAMPKGYVFVPKGDVYVTRHCRTRTHEAHRTVYVVEGKTQKTQGIRVPSFIYTQVQEDAATTASARAAVVSKVDVSRANKIRSALKIQFSQMPDDEVEKALGRTLVKRSKRVGRCGTLSSERIAFLAVQAHVRHVHTQYDKLIYRDGHSQEEARELTLDIVRDKMKEWGWNARNGFKSNKPDPKESRRTGSREVQKSGPEALKKLNLKALEKSSSKRLKRPGSREPKTLTTAQVRKPKERAWNQSSLDVMENLVERLQALDPQH